MEIWDVFAVLNVFGLFVFAISGALTAIRNQLDFLSVLIIAFFTGVGGGTIRDVLLGISPVWWVSDQSAVMICIAGAIVASVTHQLLWSRQKALIWADAIGLSVFSVAGAQSALDAGAPAIVAIFMGAVTATFGGIIRDVLLSQPSLILKQEVYATAALGGATVFVILSEVGLSMELAAILAALLTLAIRGGAIVFGYSLPKLGGNVKRDP
ncbi:MAG: trimeric intracellular cation channel family protein [Henriciella sp.]